ncbi:hypothetical protein ACJIZ3_015600 [Penstemon smallii]|uniref:Protein SHORT HYPOCOTYL IN WHITE LIGHT 1 n=1 Tax=Penstemon smallii TaxID=265156 RepID=A0ABD3RMX6_9LAMI
MAATTAALLRHPPSSHLHCCYSTASVLHFRATAQPRLNYNRSLRFVQKDRYSIHRLRNWGTLNFRNGMVMGEYGDDIDEDDDEDDDEDEEEEEEDRSLDLLIRFVENVFKKVSRKARKAVKSVLPVPISTKLVGFAVNGTIILTFLWVLKAFLEVICTLGSVVFASILLVRGIWTGISYFQVSRNYRADDDEPQAWTGTRPAI